MALKFVLVAVFLLMLSASLLFDPERRRSLHSNHNASGNLRLMTWNIGYGHLESDSRARNEDLPAMAQVILSNDPDAVALQELTGEDQLKILLTHLNNRYRGSTVTMGKENRVTAVLVKDRSARFRDVQFGRQFSAAAVFQHKDVPEILLISVHANAFSSVHRRTLTADVVDWCRANARGQIVFLAGDFNLEVSTKKPNDLFTDDAKNDSESYNYILKHFSDFGRDAGETAISNRRIDYIFGPRERATLRRAGVLRGSAIGRMDHWPLVVDVTF
ncbi:MAG TPA: endonuclease/exonuclease/phosphatase family protein [Pyrinomonadaceae bacterium]|nr:endonuclease/exonuclease/phosphatase family protein [Pyrinomonadaceae bacterium]